MADIYGVKVKLHYETGKSDLRQQLQDLLDGATANKPLYIHHFKVHKGNLEKTLSTAFKATDTPFTISNVKFNLPSDALKALQQRLDAKEFTLSIKQIKADQAVQNLRGQLVKMLSGLQIGGVKEFLSGTDIVEQGQAVENYAANLERLKLIQQQLKSQGKQILSLNTDGTELGNLREAMHDYRELMNLVTLAISANGRTDDISAWEDRVQSINDAIAAYKNDVRAANEAASAQNSVAAATQAANTIERKRLTLISQITGYIHSNTRMTNESKSTLQSYLSVLKSGNMSAETLKEISLGFQNVKVRTQEAERTGKSFFDTFQAGLKKFGGWSIVTKTLTRVITTLRQMYQAVKDVDSAMTELKRVTDLSEASYARFQKTAAQTAKRIGASMSDTINATADFARLGYDINEAAQLAEAALIYKNIGDGMTDVDQATESIISTMKAFKYEAEEAMYIVDMFNEVGNRFAISSTGIGDALKRSAAALAEGGNTLQESIGLIVAANEIIQDPDVVGTAMKSLTMYLRAAKTEAEEAGLSTDGMANSVSELRDEILQLTGQRVDIMIDEHTFKSVYQIMEELAGVWDELNDTQSSRILELIGGKRNANTLSALLSNFEKAAEAMQVALGASGSALEENEKYLDSIGGKVERLRASFQEFSTSVLDSGLVKAFIDLLNVITQIATKLNDVGGLVPLIANVAILHTHLKKMSNVKKLIEPVFTIISGTKGHKGYNSEQIETMTDAFSGLSNAQKKLATSLLQNNQAFQQLSPNQQRAILNTINLEQQVSSSIGVFGKAKSAVTGFGASIKAAWKSMGTLSKISFVVTGLQTVLGIIQAIASHIEERRKNREFYDSEAIAQAAEEAKQLNETITDNAKRYLELRDSVKHNITTNEEYIESVRNLIADLRDEGETVQDLIDRFGDLDKAMISKTIDTLRENVKKLQEAADTAHGAVSIGYKDAKYIEKPYQGTYVIPTQAKSQGIEIWYDVNPFKGQDFGEMLADIVRESGFDVVSSGLDLSVLPGKTHTTGEYLIIPQKKRGENDYDHALYLLEKYDELIAKLNDVKGASDTAFYSHITDQRALISNSLEKELAAKNTVNDALAEIEVWEYLLNNDIPRTQEEYNQMRSSVIKSLSENGQLLRSATDDVNKVSENLIDVALLDFDFAKQFGLTAMGIDGGSKKIRTAADTAFGTIKSAAEKIHDANSVLEQARLEMSSGGISADTLNGMLDLLDDDEDLFEYLYTQNGMLKLNEEAWNARTAALLESFGVSGSDIESINSEIDRLETLFISPNNILGGWSMPLILPDGFQTMEELEDHYKRLVALRDLLLNEEVSEPKFASIDNVMSIIESVTGFRAKLADGDADPLEIIQMAQNLTETLNDFKPIDGGWDWSDLVTGLQSGDLEQISIAENSLRAITDAVIDSYISTTNLAENNPELVAQLKEMAYASATAGESATGLSDALNSLNTASDFLTRAEKNDGDVLSMINQAMKMAEDLGEGDWTQFVKSFSDDGGIVWDTAAIRAYSDKILDLALANGELEQTYPGITQWLKNFAVAQSDSEDKSRSLTDAIGEYNTAISLMESLRTGDTLSALENIMDLVASGAHINMSDFFDEQGLKNADEILVAITDTLLQNLEKVAADQGITWDSAWTISLREQLTQAGIEAEETEEDIRSLTDAIGEYNTAISLMESLRAGDTLSVLENIMSLVASGAHINMSDFFDEQGLKNADEILVAITDTLLQNLEELAADQGITWDRAWTNSLREQLTQAGIEAEETEDKVRSLTDAYSELSRAIKDAPARGDLIELTYEAYKDLIAIDSRYASAVQYQNGVLTLNRDQYAAVTQEIVRSTQAQAAAEMQAIVTSEEYLDLNDRIGTLKDTEQARLDSLNAEIAGYTVLIHELDNATNAYNRFINASTETDSGRYSAAEQAREVIENTLYNAESEIYGKVGREQYVAAMDFLIDPDIEVGTDEFDAALDTIDRYIEEGTAGVRNFYDDLVIHGFIDGNGNLNASMSEMASTLGVSMDFLRAMFDELNMYQDEEHKVKIDYDTGDSEDEVKSAEEQLAILQEQVANLNTTLDVDHEIGVNVSPAETNLGKVSSAITSIIDKLTKLNGTRVTTYVNTVQTTTGGTKPGLPSLTGNASASGTFHAAGGRTLVGELGMETVVDPSTGSWYTVGRNGAEFVNLPKGAIVFNAKQTKRLFAAGRIPSRGEERGRAMAAGGLIGGSGTVSSNFAVVAFDSDSIVPSIVAGVVEGVAEASDRATGKPNLPPLEPNKNSGGSPENKLGKLNSEFEEFNKYMEHLIRHQEHLYEVAENGLNFPGMEASLVEQMRIYQDIMNKAQETVQAMIAAGADDTNKELQGIEEVYWSAYTSLHDVFDQLNALYVDALNDKIDGIQSGYSNFSEMIGEMEESGKISVDMFQQLLEHGVEYLNYLELVDGQYVINTEALEEMLAAEKEQLAIEQALAYVSQLRHALMDDDPEKVAALVNLTNQISDGTWDLVYANAAMLKTLGLTDEQYADVLHNIDMMKDLASKVNTSLADGTEAYKEQEDALDRILDFTEQLIKYETEEKIRAIEDEIDAYQELVDLRKEALETARDEADYTSDVAERTKEIASLESRIAQLSLDDSREARAERAALEEELAELQGDLADVQGDHAYDLQIDALDQSAEDYRTSREAEIAELEEMISSAEKLYQLALQRIDTGWESLYNELIAWNIEAGSVLNSEITSNWELALEAAQRYGSYVEAIVARTGNPVAITPVDTSELPVYHDGGVVEASGVNHDEVVAVLEKEEAVLTKKQRAGLYRIVDFAKELSARLGTAVKELALPFLPMTPALAGVDGVGGTVVSNQNSMVFSPEIHVQISHSGAMTDADARSFGRQIGNIAMQEMQQAFDRRGIGGIFGGGLKQ